MRKENILDAREFHYGGTWFSKVRIEDPYQEQSPPKRSNNN